MPWQDVLPYAFEAVLDSNLFVTLPAKTREHGDYLPHGMRDQHQDTEERSARKRARSVLKQREVERSTSRL